MPGNHRLVSSTPVTLTTTAETVVATSNGVSTVSDQDQVAITGWAQLTLGTGTTSVTPRIRRGTSVSGTLVGTGNPINGTAGQTIVESFLTEDTPGLVAGQQYVFTLQQTGATANGSALQSSIDVTFPTN